MQERSSLLFIICLVCLILSATLAILSGTTTTTTTPHKKNLVEAGAEQKSKIETMTTRPVFSPFPHRSTGSGKEATCTWITRTVPQNVNKSDAMLYPNGANGNYSPDEVQRRAFADGICLPEDPLLASNIHVFSAAEGIECLSPSRGEKIRVVVAGDSYNMQLFIGLADVLLKRVSNEEIRNGTQRRTVLEETASVIGQKLKNGTGFPNIQFVCDPECYGKFKVPFSEQCSKCINQFTKNQNTVAVVGAGVHIYADHDGRTNETLNEILKFFHMADRVIFNSFPNYQTSRIPPKYRNNSYVKALGPIYLELLSHVAPQNNKTQFLDFFQLTSSCFMDNCSADGGHRARYVNRWKAQLLLNAICEFRSVY